MFIDKKNQDCKNVRSRSTAPEDTTSSLTIRYPVDRNGARDDPSTAKGDRHFSNGYQTHNNGGKEDMLASDSDSMATGCVIFQCRIFSERIIILTLTISILLWLLPT